jgi:hypothetical protein
MIFFAASRRHDSVLQETIRRADPIRTIEETINLLPDAIRRKDMAGFLPLYVAVLHGASLPVIDILGDAFPHALLEGDDSHGRLPMHVAAQEASLKVVQLLIKKSGCPSV